MEVSHLMVHITGSLAVIGAFAYLALQFNQHKLLQRDQSTQLKADPASKMEELRLGVAELYTRAKESPEKLSITEQTILSEFTDHQKIYHHQAMQGLVEADTSHQQASHQQDNGEMTVEIPSSIMEAFWLVCGTSSEPESQTQASESAEQHPDE